MPIGAATSSIEDELEHAVQYGDATELWVLERAGIQRADLVVAVTGDDEDNMLVCQVAKEKYLCDRVIARVNNPRNLQHFKLLGIQPVVSATDLILRLIEHEVPRYGLVHLLALEEERLEIIELEVAPEAPVVGQAVADVALPEGSLIISVLRDGSGFVPTADTSSRPATRCCWCSTRASRRRSPPTWRPRRALPFSGAFPRGLASVAPCPRSRLAVAVGTEDLEVLEPVVLAVTVDVVQRQGNRSVVPLLRAARLAPTGLQASVVQALLYVVAIASRPRHQELIEGYAAGSRRDEPAPDRLVPSRAAKPEGRPTCCDAVAPLVELAHGLPVVPLSELGLDPIAEFPRVKGDR